MSFNPTVSIVIPVYNGANYLRAAIESALAQTYGYVEILVVNDGSNDGGKTEEIALSYGGTLRYLVKENGGVASALNHGIRNMTGEYLSWLSHDDVYYPGKLERQIGFLRGREDTNIVLYSDFEIFDGNSISIALHHLDKKITENPLRAILSAAIHGCSTLVPKAAFERMGLFNERLRTVQDNEMWLRVFQGGINFVHIPEILIKSRVHPEQGQLTLGAINRLETIQFYNWAFDTLHEEIRKDEGAILEVLANKGINLPLGILRRSSAKSREFSWQGILGYKVRVYFRKISRRIVQRRKI